MTRARISLMLIAVLVGGALGSAWARQHPTYVSRSVIEFVRAPDLEGDDAAAGAPIESRLAVLTVEIASAFIDSQLGEVRQRLSQHEEVVAQARRTGQHRRRAVTPDELTVAAV